ncbi:hypothetical protein AVEN_261875-1, partial [Araneus ventricosus]
MVLQRLSVPHGRRSIYFLGKPALNQNPTCDTPSRKWRFRLVKPSYMWLSGWVGMVEGALVQTRSRGGALSLA